MAAMLIPSALANLGSSLDTKTQTYLKSLRSDEHNKFFVDVLKVTH